MHIMLVADNPVEGKRLAEWLCAGLGQDCQIEHFDNLNEALIQIQATPGTIDVLIVDLIIPPDHMQMLGLGLAQHRAPRMGIVVVSDQDDEDVVRTAIRSGAQEFWVKSGLDAKRLSTIVTNAMMARQRMVEGLQGVQSTATGVQQAIVLCELSPLAVELLARQAQALGLTTQATLEKLILESCATPDVPSGIVAPGAP